MKLRVILICIFLSISFTLEANDENSCFQGKTESADKKYEDKEYQDSISLYKEAYQCATEKSQKIKTLASLATSEHAIGNLKATKEYLNQLLEISPDNKWANDFSKYPPAKPGALKCVSRSKRLNRDANAALNYR